MTKLWTSLSQSALFIRIRSTYERTTSFTIDTTQHVFRWNKRDLSGDLLKISGHSPKSNPVADLYATTYKWEDKANVRDSRSNNADSYTSPPLTHSPVPSSRWRGSELTLAGCSMFTNQSKLNERETELVSNRWNAHSSHSNRLWAPTNTGEKLSLRTPRNCFYGPQLSNFHKPHRRSTRDGAST